MYEVMQSSLTEVQKLQIADELEKLFTLQDRPFSQKRAAIFIEELEKSNLPAGAIISGIRSLMTDDLGKITYEMIFARSRSKIEREEIKSKECDHCFGSGVVSMRDEVGYEFLYVCSCENSKKYQDCGLAKWNSEAIQIHNGKKFKKRFM